MLPPSLSLLILELHRQGKYKFFIWHMQMGEGRGGEGRGEEGESRGGEGGGKIEEELY